MCTEATHACAQRHLEGVVRVGGVRIQPHNVEPRARRVGEQLAHDVKAAAVACACCLSGPCAPALVLNLYCVINHARYQCLQVPAVHTTEQRAPHAQTCMRRDTKTAFTESKLLICHTPQSLLHLLQVSCKSGKRYGEKQLRPV